LRTIEQLTHEDDDLPSSSIDVSVPVADVDSADSEETQETTDPLEQSAANDPTEEDRLVPNTFTVSWPWNADHDEISSTSYLIRDDKLHIVFNAGPEGLGFNRRLVKFGMGPEYRELALSSWGSNFMPRRRDRRPLVISFPFAEAEIAKVTYEVDDGVLTLLVIPWPDSELRIRRSDVEFSRGVLVDDQDEKLDGESDQPD